MHNQVYIAKHEFILVKTVTHTNSEPDQWTDLVYQNRSYNISQSLYHPNA